VPRTLAGQHRLRLARRLGDELEQDREIAERQLPRDRVGELDFQ